MHSIKTLGRILLPFAAALLTAVTFVAGASAQELVEGKQYVRVKNPPPIEKGSKIEVLEFFSYGCPHCADLEPEIQSWAKTIPSDVSFVRIPVVFQERWVALAKIFYTLEALGVEPKYSIEVFTAMHKGGVNMTSDKVFFDWAAAKGLDRKKVEDVYNSFAISGKLNRAKSEAQKFNIQSVPTVIVDGKFLTAPDKAGSHAAMPPTINALIAKARAERQKS